VTGLSGKTDNEISELSQVGFPQLEHLSSASATCEPERRWRTSSSWVWWGFRPGWRPCRNAPSSCGRCFVATSSWSRFVCGPAHLHRTQNTPPAKLTWITIHLCRHRYDR